MQSQKKKKIDVSADFEDEQNDLKNITYPIGTLGTIGWFFTIFGIVFLIIGVFVSIGSGIPMFLLCFGLIGGIFAIIGIVFLKKIYTRIKREKKSVEAGQYIYASVSSIALNTHVRINEQNPWVITASFYDPMDQSRHEFRSRNLMQDISVIHPGDMIRVYVNAPYYDAYYMDVEELLRNKQS